MALSFSVESPAFDLLQIRITLSHKNIGYMGGRHHLLLAPFPEMSVEGYHNCGVKLFAGGKSNPLVGTEPIIKCGEERLPRTV